MEEGQKDQAKTEWVPERWEAPTELVWAILQWLITENDLMIQILYI